MRADLVGAQEGVPMSSIVHVFIPVEDQAHGAAQYIRGHSSRSIPGHAAGLLASKSSPDALDMAHHLVLGDAQDMCNGLLML